MKKLKLTRSEVAAWAGLVRAQQLLLGNVEAELKRHELPPLAWYDVLLELQRQPDGRLRLSEIGKQVLLSKYNVTRLVDRLERKGLVARVACEDDARGAFAAITKDGQALLERMWPVYHQSLQTHLFKHFGEKELDQMAAFMRRIIAVNG
ncbi:MAG TPA: MarR family transcriptional regulator [Kiloniellaceae bacterium]|nr:MarR family transcriptional regulator [Kiloniellaceae bacterium]